MAKARLKRKNTTNSDGVLKPGRPRNPGAVRLTHHQISQKNFNVVEYYMQGYSKTDSLRMAGYSEGFARRNHVQIFQRADVQDEIELRRSAIRRRGYRIQERVLDELTKIAFFNFGTIIAFEDNCPVYDFSTVTMDELAAIGEVTIEKRKIKGSDDEIESVKLKPYSKMDALIAVARVQGMFKDSINVMSDGASVEERLMQGRKRLNKPEEPVTDAEFEELDHADN